MDKGTQNQASDLYERGIRLADALNAAFEIFTSHREAVFDELMTKGICPVADAAGLDRVDICRLVGEGRDKRPEQVYLWDRSQGGTAPPNGALSVFTGNPAAAWLAVLAKGSRISRCRV